MATQVCVVPGSSLVSEAGGGLHFSCLPPFHCLNSERIVDPQHFKEMKSLCRESKNRVRNLYAAESGPTPGSPFRVSRADAIPARS